MPVEYSWIQKNIFNIISDGVSLSGENQNEGEISSPTPPGVSNIVSGDTSNIQCPIYLPGVKDGGVKDGYRNGKLIKIRVCLIKGSTGKKDVDINSQIAEKVYNLFKAAERDGIKISAGGFRTMSEQIGAAKANGCYKNGNFNKKDCDIPTATPGYSNHQMGLALDITDSTGGTIKSRASKEYKWLALNAHKYGLYNLPSEPWHWSVNGQ
jgi:LAS superfamily LD-carboxypeptidase LdcB